jgi:hypothetical protein
MTVTDWLPGKGQAGTSRTGFGWRSCLLFLFLLVVVDRFSFTLARTVLSSAFAQHGVWLVEHVVTGAPYIGFHFSLPSSRTGPVMQWEQIRVGVLQQVTLLLAWIRHEINARTCLLTSIDWLQKISIDTWPVLLLVRSLAAYEIFFDKLLHTRSGKVPAVS